MREEWVSHGLSLESCLAVWLCAAQDWYGSYAPRMMLHVLGGQTQIKLHLGKHSCGGMLLLPQHKPSSVTVRVALTD